MPPATPARGSSRLRAVSRSSQLALRDPVRPASVRTFREISISTRSPSSSAGDLHRVLSTCRLRRRSSDDDVIHCNAASTAGLLGRRDPPRHHAIVGGLGAKYTRPTLSISATPLHTPPESFPHSHGRVRPPAPATGLMTHDACRVTSRFERAAGRK